jgi:hypothetical protein
VDRGQRTNFQRGFGVSKRPPIYVPWRTFNAERNGGRVQPGILFHVHTCSYIPKPIAMVHDVHGWRWFFRQLSKKNVFLVIESVFESVSLNHWSRCETSWDVCWIGCLRTVTQRSVESNVGFTRHGPSHTNYPWVGLFHMVPLVLRLWLIPFKEWLRKQNYGSWRNSTREQQTVHRVAEAGADNPKMGPGKSAANGGRLLVWVGDWSSEWWIHWLIHWLIKVVPYFSFHLAAIQKV